VDLQIVDKGVRIIRNLYWKQTAAIKLDKHFFVRNMRLELGKN